MTPLGFGVGSDETGHYAFYQGMDSDEMFTSVAHTTQEKAREEMERMIARFRRDGYVAVRFEEIAYA